MDTILKLDNITKSFPGVKALQGIHLEIARGEIHALLGENGAGKSTLMKILCGIYQPDEGTITIAGEARHFTNYHDAVAAGVGIVFQEFSLIPYLNAVENMFLGRELRNALGLLERGKMRRAAAAIFQRLGVAIDLSVPIRELSVAQQQFVEIGKALSLEARILILDEPTATLTPAEAGHLFAIMRDLKQQGVAMIFISHHLEEIFEVCDRITVLRDGQYVGMTEVAQSDVNHLVEMMVGRRIENSFPPKPPLRADAKIVLEVDKLQLLKDSPILRFTLREGEILGFAGLVGSGRTETALAVIGADPAYVKEIRINGTAAKLSDPADALRAGVGILPESRKTEGLITDFSIKQNISINNLGKYRSLRFTLAVALERRNPRNQAVRRHARFRIQIRCVTKRFDRHGFRRHTVVGHAHVQVLRTNADGDLVALLHRARLHRDTLRLAGFVAHRDAIMRHRLHDSFHEIHLRRTDKTGDEAIGRRVIQHGRAADLLHIARRQHDDLVGQRHGFDLIVRHVDHRGLQLVVQTREFEAHFHAQRGVQIRQGFVEQEHFRLARNRAADCNPLTLTA